MSTPAQYAPSSYTDLCYVGPLGALVGLPDVAANGGVSVAVTRNGGMHRSLAGGVTIDTFSRKRSWSWSWSMLLPKQVAYVEALQWGHIEGPLRLIDPRRPNRLPEDIATCGTTSKTAESFFTDNDSVAYWRPLSQMPGDVSTLGPRRLLSGGLEWQILTPVGTGNGLIAKDPKYTDSVYRVPIFPNERMRFSCWALFPANAQVGVGLSWRQADGKFITSSFSGYLPGGGDEWVELEIIDYAVDGAAFGLPFFDTRTPYMPTATSVYTTGWQVTSPSLSTGVPPGITEHCDVPDLGGGWSQGGGAPFVVVDVGTDVYSRPGFHDLALTLHES